MLEAAPDAISASPTGSAPIASAPRAPSTPYRGAGHYAFTTGAIADALTEHPPAWIEARGDLLLRSMRHVGSRVPI
jgi:hypothetical protein